MRFLYYSIAHPPVRWVQVTQHFPDALGVDDFISRMEIALHAYGFQGHNTIACCNLCRDEVTCTLKHKLDQVSSYHVPSICHSCIPAEDLRYNCGHQLARNLLFFFEQSETLTGKKYGACICKPCRLPNMCRQVFQTPNFIS